MRKIFFTFLALLFAVNIGYSQVTTLWEKSVGAASKPSWFSPTGSTERGFGYGLVNSNHRLYIPSRNGGNFVYIYNAVTGDSVGNLRTDGMTGGTFVLNDCEVSSNGVIFVCNLSTNISTSPFKVYKYTTESDSPVVAINYTGTAAARLGDKFTVTGSTADNSIIIWAASGNTQELYKFTTTDNGNTFSATVLPLSGLTGTGFGTASVGPFTGEKFYWNANGWNPKRYNADGTVTGTIPGTVVSTGSNSIRFIKSFLGDEYIVTFAYGSGNENGRVINVRDAIPDSAILYGVTNSLGTNSNGNGTGDVAVRRISDLVYNVFVLGTNNGFGAYQVDLTIPPLAGDYYVGAPGTGPGGSDPEFASLREAYQTLNNATFADNCTFYITSNITEVTSPGGLGLAINPDPYTVTFKPYTGVQPVITLPYTSDSNSGPSGAMVIGIPMENNIAWNDLRTTKNIVFDGSNTPGGTTRDLTFTNLTNSVGNAFPFAIVGAVSNLVLKNCNIFYKAQTTSTSNLFRAAVQLRGRLQNTLNWTPMDITIENNHISTNFAGVSQGMQGIVTVALSPQPTTYMSGIVIKNNLIEGTQRAIGLGWSASTDIINNGLILNQSVSATTANQVIVAANIFPNSVVNIYDNRISSILSVSNGATAGNTGISIESAGTYNVYNNMIAGFNLTATNPVAFLRGLAVTSASATANIYYNSIFMTNLSDIGSGTVAYNGLYISDGINDVKNNIVVSAETDFVSYCINRTGALGTFTSDYNNFFPVSLTNGNVGFWNTAATPTLTDWQTASGQDANSVSKEVFFVSTTDLHLTGTSNGDFDLAGTPIAWITTDIDGDTRSATFPYMGVDEAPTPIPVELSAFNATIISGDVHLKWSTASETNNQGFEIERSSGKTFVKIGFVPGNGTTTERHNYSFVDSDIDAGKYTYRLKQIDFNGAYTYSNSIEVDISVPLKFDLSQNYPNPFNPTTMINYEIAKPVNVNLVIYNTLGEQVAVLIDNQLTEPGKYTVRFDASNYASGTYIYRLTAGDFVQTKKMMLTK